MTAIITNDSVMQTVEEQIKDIEETLKQLPEGTQLVMGIAVSPDGQIQTFSRMADANTQLKVLYQVAKSVFARIQFAQVMEEGSQGNA